MSKYKLPTDYGSLTTTQRREVREQYIKEQERLCSFCGNSLYGSPSKKSSSYRIYLRLFPKGFLRNKIHLHHCHNTGLTIGAVHAYCNAVLWQHFGE